jgi:hypothetical protein
MTEVPAVSPASRFSPQKLAAQFVEKFGWPVFPTCGKVPAVRGVSWQDIAARNPAEVAAQEGWLHADGYGVAIPPHAMVVDLDTDEDGGLDTAYRVVAGFPALLADSVNTLRVQTPSGGQHWYFNVADLEFEPRSGRPFGADVPVDIKAFGGYVIGPGSRGGKYKAITKPKEIAVTSFPWAAGVLTVH